MQHILLHNNLRMLNFNIVLVNSVAEIAVEKLCCLYPTSAVLSADPDDLVQRFPNFPPLVLLIKYFI